MTIQEKYEKLGSFTKDILKRFADSGKRLEDCPSIIASGITQELVDYEKSKIN